MIKIGDQAPVFALPDENGTMHSLLDYFGQWTLLYFYPKDDTPGCAAQACSIKKVFPSFQKLDIAVFGISVDSVQSHMDFKQKYELPFHLLSDTSKAVSLAYGVIKEADQKELSDRSSFLLDPNGDIFKIYTHVDPESHADDVLRDIQSAQK